jgi:hypothetical protein
MKGTRTYYHFKYEVNSHYEDSVAAVLLNQQKFTKLLRVVLLDENRLFECIQNTADITISKIENDDLNENREVVESCSALPFVEIFVSNIKFNYWYEDENDKEWEFSFPEEMLIRFNEDNEAVYWTKEGAPLIIKGYEEEANTAGLYPTKDSNLGFLFELLFEDENRFDWILETSIHSGLDNRLSKLEGKSIEKDEASFFGILNLVYENGESDDMDVDRFIEE